MEAVSLWKRAALAAVFYMLRTGIQWKALPTAFGSSSAVHRYFPFWCEPGVFQSLWKAALAKYDEVSGIDWTWLSADGWKTRAPLALEMVGNNPTDREKTGANVICWQTAREFPWRW